MDGNDGGERDMEVELLPFPPHVLAALDKLKSSLCGGSIEKAIGSLHSNAST